MVKKFALLLFIALPLHAWCAQTIVVLGDSLSSSYGINKEAGWVALLQNRLKKDRLDYNVVNASITGETSRGGLARLNGILKSHRPAILIVELGGNDGLRGSPLDALYTNLRAIVDAAQQNGSKVLLLGMRLPPNYGRAYTDGFHQVFTHLSKERRTALVPFMLDGFAEDARFFLPDRIHPNVHAQPYILDNVWKTLKPMLQTVTDKRSK